MQRLKVAIVDDSRIYRSIIEECLKDVPQYQVVASLFSGEKLLQFIQENEVDVITLDVEMPGMNGLEVLREVQRFNQTQKKNIGVIMLSGLTHKGASATMEALELGAFDFIPKPSQDEPNAAKTLKSQLLQKLKGWDGVVHPTIAKRISKKSPLTKEKPVRESGKAGEVDLILIGVSTGGPKALNQLLPELCKVVHCPVLIVQHMPPGFTTSLAEGLNKRCPGYGVIEAHDKSRLENNMVYIAPGGKHMMLRTAAGGRLELGLNAQPPENGCRPSVDVLFRSAAQAARDKRFVAIILTGMGIDGTAGIRPLKRAGVKIIAQDEATSVVYGMPASAVSTGMVDAELPLMEIPKSVGG